MADCTIRAIPNGPYRLTGPARLTDPQGNETVIEEGRAVSLCRCGASVRKPYCDGTHSRIGFQAAEAAVALAAPATPPAPAAAPSEAEAQAKAQALEPKPGA